MLESIWQGLALTNGHHKDMCHNEIGLCAKNILIDLYSIDQLTLERGEKNKNTFTLDFCNRCICIPILKLGRTIFVISKC